MSREKHVHAILAIFDWYSMWLMAGTVCEISKAEVSLQQALEFWSLACHGTWQELLQCNLSSLLSIFLWKKKQTNSMLRLKGSSAVGFLPSILLPCSWHIKLLATLLLCCQESGAPAKTKIKHWLWRCWAQPPLCCNRYLIPDPPTLPRIPARTQQPLASPSQQGSALHFKMCQAAGKAQRPLRASALLKQLGSVAAPCSALGAQISSWRPITRLGRANEQPWRGHELPKEQMCPKSVPVNFVTYWNHGEIYTANYWLCFWFNHPSLHLSVKVRREKMLVNSMSEAGWCFK